MPTSAKSEKNLSNVFGWPSTMTANTMPRTRSTYLLMLMLLLAAPAKGLMPLRSLYMSSSPPTISDAGSGTGAVLSGSLSAGTTSFSASTTSTISTSTIPTTKVRPPVSRDVPSWAYLPSKPDFSNMDLPLRAEIWIGRLAMAGAIGLVATELSTGISFVDQFLDLLVAHADGAGVQ